MKLYCYNAMEAHVLQKTKKQDLEITYDSQGETPKPHCVRYNLTVNITITTKMRQFPKKVNLET